MAGPVFAQTPPPGPIVAPRGGLLANPQQGATPRLAPPSPELPPASVPRSPVVAPLPAPSIAGPLIQSPVVRGEAMLPAAAPVMAQQGGLWAQVPGGLPAPTNDPMRIDPATDPVLHLARVQTSAALFDAVIAAAVRRAPSLDEAIAQREEAVGAHNEAIARRAPVADLSLSTFKIISRAFSNDPNNILERSRPDHRTDGTVHVQVPVIDFGATGQRIAASQARLDATIAGVEDTGSQLALRAVGAWYNVYGYRALVRLGEAFTISQRDLRSRIEQRVQQGAAASGDVAQVDSYIASSDAQLADFRRSLANASAQYAAIVGEAAPPSLGRAPVPDLGGIGSTGIDHDTAGLPAVRATQLSAAAAARDVKALRADRLPQLSGAIDAGRYGVIENARDYDMRGTVTISMRIGGGAAQRIEQARARVDGAEARFRRTHEDATRDAQIAYSDVQALEEARTALEANYIASRRSRDVLAERFRVSRGTLFDLLGAESNYFGVAARYIQAVIELDTARYVLLARTGRLLSTLAIDPRSLDPHPTRIAPFSRNLP
ncbi:TolC family protein [Sphingomonas sp. CROZ-RG-20F-R02-07]|uniref:TolC family protein n=1 Tax=Sphingomonas sp. CROZ-RG-20F-R02-07 TaxID=2914832 RepID=UPI001F59EFA5|nr:TolC family protein [Sphingomonas sp. CROZ-RG-20F-R02-07]